MSDLIFIEDLIVPVHIGCSKKERKIAQSVRLNIYMEFDSRAAGASDKLSDALDYVKAYHLIQGIVDNNAYVLLERLCAVCADALLELGAQSVKISASKERCPIPGFQGRVGVEIIRKKDQ